LTRRKFIDVLKWAWIVVVLLGAGWYFYRHYQEISQYLGTISIIRLILCFLLLMAGKLALSDISRLSLKKVYYSMPYSEALTITTVTQLGKYLPGGIWHFAGKFGVYRVKGISTKNTTQAMVIENLWLLSSAGIVGAVAFLASSKETACQYINFLCSPAVANAVAFWIPILWITGLLIFETLFFGKQKVIWGDFLIGLAEMIFIWLVFGLSFWLIFPANSGHFPQALGAFSLSWLAGYVAIFAPGGIGIRELLLTVLLGAFFKSSEVAIYAAIHRLLWVFAELFLGGLSAMLFGLPVGSNELSNNKK
jgi:uncharacterized membrane protein YbhN (UPF0104 family)